MPLGLLALAIGAFGIGLTEFVIMGLLPDLAADFGVSEAAAGWFISGYALAVAVGAIGLTAAATRLPRKPVLMGLLGLFIAGNAISALAPTYEAMLAGRIVAALCHGAFFGIGAVVAADLVAPAKRAGAIAVMFTGLTAANVLGVPFGTFLGQQFGWRSTFWVISAVGVLALIGIAALVPGTRSDARVDRAPGAPAAPAPAVPSLRRELGAFRSGHVWLSLGVTVLGFGGMFGAFTYIAYTLTEVSGFAPTDVPWLLVLFGAGLVVGNWIGGKLADRSIDGTLLGFIGALVVVLALFGLLAASPVAVIVLLVLMGGFGFGTVPALQSRIMRHADQAPTLASGANIAAFNLGNALGAFAGGVAISAGLGYTSPIWVGAIITAAALILMVVAWAAARAGATASAPAREPVTAPDPVATAAPAPERADVAPRASTPTGSVAASAR